MDKANVRAALLRWYERHRRDLPWRRTRDAYAIWVAEIMLQQTQVATVIPFYERFVERFPDLRALARASIDEVLSLWSGLGYYRRARALHAAAREVARRHEGRLPRDPQALRALPGIGRYTAGAIASTAFDVAEPVLDGNVRRVLSRLAALDGRRAGPAAEKRRLWQLAGELVVGRYPGNLNQALMELGATVCTPRNPRCGACPVSRCCSARRQGDPTRYPAPIRRPPTSRIRAVVAVVRRGARVLLERPCDGELLRGRWDLPAAMLADGQVPETAVRRMLLRRHGIAVGGPRHLGHVNHAIMNRRLRLEVYLCSLRRGRTARRPDLRWTETAAIGETPVSGATTKVLRLLQSAITPEAPPRSAPVAGSAR